MPLFFVPAACMLSWLSLLMSVSLPPFVHSSTSADVDNTIPFFDNYHSLVHRFIVLPQYNFMFCWIDKVACTNFHKLFNTIEGKKHLNKRHATLYRNDVSTLALNESTIHAMLMNSSWYKGVFYRRPLDRFVSAYTTQCKGTRKPRHCADTYQIHRRKPSIQEVANITRRYQGRSFGAALKCKQTVH